jgi:hypothetical protein
MWLGRPLHGGTRTNPLWEIEIVAHAKLVSITDDGGARQREHQAVRKFEPTPVSVEHRRKSSPDAAIVELHVP